MVLWQLRRRKSRVLTQSLKVVECLACSAALAKAGKVKIRQASAKSAKAYPKLLFDAGLEAGARGCLFHEFKVVAI
jgi:hypothetical protein